MFQFALLVMLALPVMAPVTWQVCPMVNAHGLVATPV
jgi:hypothetical protein